jgi:hypothetical protein
LVGVEFPGMGRESAIGQLLYLVWQGAYRVRSLFQTRAFR